MSSDELVASIDDTAVGQWIITTESGTTYRLDLDQRRLLRAPGGVSMRRDLEELELFNIVQCAVGAMGLFHVQVRDDHVSTVRMTTPILSIERMVSDPS